MKKINFFKIYEFYIIIILENFYINYFLLITITL